MLKDEEAPKMMSDFWIGEDDQYDLIQESCPESELNLGERDEKVDNELDI